MKESFSEKLIREYLPHTADKVVHERYSDGGWNMILYRDGEEIARYEQFCSCWQPPKKCKCFDEMPDCMIDIEDRWDKVRKRKNAKQKA